MGLPKIGLLEKASRKFDIDLKKSFIIGDKTADIQTGKNAGCKTILVKTGYGGSNKKFDVKPDFICENLLTAAKLITGAKNGCNNTCRRKKSSFITVEKKEFRNPCFL